MMIEWGRGALNRDDAQMYECMCESCKLVNLVMERKNNRRGRLNSFDGNALFGVGFPMGISELKYTYEKTFERKMMVLSSFVRKEVSTCAVTGLDED